jgi:hypothetical protein
MRFVSRRGNGLKQSVLVMTLAMLLVATTAFEAAAHVNIVAIGGAR